MQSGGGGGDRRCRAWPLASTASCFVLFASCFVLLTPSCARNAYVRPTSPFAAQPAEEAETVGAGTLASAQVKQPISTATSHPGDRFTAELLDPLIDGSGREVVGRGAVLQGVVRGTSRSVIAGSSAGLQLQILGVESPGEGLVQLPVEVADTPVELNSGFGREALGALAGIAVGAGAGIAIDKDRSGVVLGSALVGAGLGALVTYVFGTREATLPSGSVVTLRMVRPLHLAQPVAQEWGPCRLPPSSKTEKKLGSQP
jgi:hypothetical protein